MENKPVSLTEKDILTILQNAQSVPLGSPIWESGTEYDKLVKIIHSAINYTAPRELSDEEIREVAKKHLGHSMGLLNWHSFARAILKKASEK